MVEWLQGHDQECIVGFHLAVEHAVADDRGDAGNAVRAADDLLHLLGNGIRAIDRCAFRQLDFAEDGALVLGRKKAGRRNPEQPAGAHRNTRECDEAQHRNSDQPLDDRSVAVADQVYAGQDIPDRAASRPVARSEEDGTKGGRQRQRIDGRDHHRHRDRHRELPEQLACNAWDEGDRHVGGCRASLLYGTFVDDFRSLLGELPHNTIGVYSYSKYFGATGWRLGVIAIHEDNIFDKKIAKLPDADVKALDKRYSPLTLEPRKMKFIDRIVADSRDVGLNHTAGLSLPQQVMMSLFSLCEMMDVQKRYQAACKEIVHRRVWSMIESLGLHLTPNPNFDAYYGLIDFEFWARKNIGEDAVEYLKKNVHPLDLAFRLAEDHGIVLLNGGGFEAPDWSLRVSLANLPDEAYDDIGRGVRTVARGYRDAYEASRAAAAK